MVTGAADDDPSGLGTYTQIGARFGYALGWTLLLSWPLMAAIQEACARIGCITGQGLAGALRRHAPGWALWPAVALLVVANVVNLAADLGAMAAAASGLVVGGPRWLWAVAFGLLCVWVPAWLDYRRYAATLRWLTLALLAYPAVALLAGVEWRAALTGLALPRLPGGWDALEALVAVLGTTISPYLFFWQASLEAEERRARTGGSAGGTEPPAALRAELRRIRFDTVAGMGISNLVGWFVVVAAAATLHAAGRHEIGTVAEAAEALRPLAGDAAGLLFALGLIGTGMLALPAFAASIAYAVEEAAGWREQGGLDRPFRKARGFYALMALVVAMGGVAEPLGLDPVRALYWAAVVNGLLAPPLMAAVMWLSDDPRVVGPECRLPGWLRLLGWLATLAMGAAAAALVLAWLR
nr:divalent metal cation transporter [Caldovatus aquaticus]